MSTLTNLKLHVDLQRGVIPISKAASSLATLIKWARGSGQPVIVTQKGYPISVLLPIELFATLKDLAERTAGPDPAEPGGAAPAEAAEPADVSA